MKNEIYHNGVLISVKDDRTLNEAKEIKIEMARHYYSEAISIAGLDSITQQNAALGIYPPERCEAIKSYIAACRNEYLRCKALIQAAQTNAEADAVQFLAPPVPEGM